MKRPILYCFWGFFFVVCGILGNLENPEGFRATAMTLLSIGFFIPPALLLADGWKKDDRKLIRTIRYISIGSLVLTLGFLIANIGAVNASEMTGNVLYQILIYVSVPMVCSRFFALSIFLWACLLFATFPKFIQKK